jgi:AcrR family transcriptional regulator
MAGSWDRARHDHRSQQAEAIAAAALELLLGSGASALSMSAIAESAGVSRQTLYRYYGDVDAVLVGIAELVAAGDAGLESALGGLDEPVARLEWMLDSVVGAEGHGDQISQEVRGALPPAARELLTAHEARVRGLLARVLADGIDAGVFSADLLPAEDAALLLGLAAAAEPGTSRRVITLVHRIVDRRTEEMDT